MRRNSENDVQIGESATTCGFDFGVRNHFPSLAPSFKIESANDCSTRVSRFGIFEKNPDVLELV